MNIQELKNSDLMIFEYVRGSHMYGTNTPKSDIDMGGLFVVPNNEWLSLFNPSQEIKDERGDNQYLEIKKYLTLACSANPTVLETMFCPKDCIKLWKPQMDILVENRQMFVTKKCQFSFSNYAFAQIKKARGQNKKVHNVEKLCNVHGIEVLRKALLNGELTHEWVETRFNADFLKFVCKDIDLSISDKTDWKEMDRFMDLPSIKEMEKPHRINFIYFIKDELLTAMRDRYEDVIGVIPRLLNIGLFPARTVKMTDLSGFDVSAVNHIDGLYRLYKNGSVLEFVGESMKCTSIPKEREWDDYIGLLYFSRNEYEIACREWKSFWEWMSNRNEQRWTTDWKEDMDYDCKNMCHVMRLMFEAQHILQHGFPKVRWDGEKQKFLLDVRAGKFEYEYLLKMAEEMMADLKTGFEKSNLPDQVPMKKVDKLYRNILNL